MKTNNAKKHWLRKTGNFAYLFGIAFLIASVITSILPPTTASAHAAFVSGSASCQSNGTYSVTWTITQDWNTTMTINSTNPDIGLGGANVAPGGSAQGHNTYPGTTSGNVSLSVNVTWPADNYSTSKSGSVRLGGNCLPPATKTPTNTSEAPTNTPTNTSVPPSDTPTNTPITPSDTPTNTSVVPSDTPTNTPVGPTNTPTNTPTATAETNYQLNLSHIACVNGQVEIHFVLLNVPDGITPGSISYTYGSISPGNHTGNVWHYYDYKPSGYYNVTSASVNVGGTQVNLHNPGAYSDTYTCGPTATPVTPSYTPTNTPETPTNTPTPTYTPTNTPTETITLTPTSTSTGTITATYTPTITSTNTPVTPTDTPTDTPSNTPETPTATSTNTSTPNKPPTDTPTPPDPFSLIAYCTGIRVISHNDFEASFAWTINGGPSGTGVVEPFGFVDIPTDYYPGALVILYSNNQVMATATFPSNCDEVQNTPTPPVVPSRTPGSTSTRTNPTEVFKTLEPKITSTEDILIPVTGVDLTGGGSTSSTLFNFGLAFLGFGLVMNGIARQRKEQDI